MVVLLVCKEIKSISKARGKKVASSKGEQVHSVAGDGCMHQDVEREEVPRDKHEQAPESKRDENKSTCKMELHLKLRLFSVWFPFSQ